MNRQDVIKCLHPITNCLCTHFIFLSIFVAKVGEACPARLGFLVSTICSLITLVGEGGWRTTICAQISALPKKKKKM